MPKTRGDLVLWIANLAVTGALKYRWGKEYWTWNGKDSDSVVPTKPRLISPPKPLKINEAERLVKVESAQD